tara:strand:- start:1033 stop:1347 length:315 start_codon:yes stop_codon:yes gene_type:complete
VAAYWAGESLVDESFKDAVALGVEGMPEPKEDILEVIPEAWPAVKIFLHVQTQWRVDSGNVVGLDYMAVKWVFDLLEVKKPMELLADLQVIEAKVIEIISKRSG